MICAKCNHTLPDDSEFCQYCGNKLEIHSFINKSNVEAEGVPTPISQDTEVKETITSDEVIAAALDAYVKGAVDAMDANSREQPNHEDEADFGLVPEKPIYTIALKLIDGKEEYLNKLRAISGEKIKWKRRGATSVSGVNGIVDIYDTYLPSGQFYKTIYLNMYGAKESQKAPQGFVLAENVVANQKDQKFQTKKRQKTKFCKRCGAKIDDDTKICMGCGKKYLKITKVYVIAAVLSVAIIVVTTLSVLQFISNTKLQDEIIELEWQLSCKEKTIGQLEKQADNLETKNRKNSDKVEFFDNHAALVERGSQKYHKYGCNDFEGSSFWIYNTEAAVDRGYYPCPNCH